MPDPELIRRMSQKTRVNALVAEAQEGELSTSELAELAGLLSVSPGERAAITQAAIEKLIILRMPAGRIEDLRRAFAAAQAAQPAGMTPPPPAGDAREAQDDAAASGKGYSSQRTRAVAPAFKVPFEPRAERTTAIRMSPSVPEAPAPPEEPPSPPVEPGPEPAGTAEPPVTESQSVAEWAELQAELMQLSDLAQPKPPEVPATSPASPARQGPVPSSARQPTPTPPHSAGAPRAPLPLRGKAAQLLNRGSAAAPPLPRTPPAPPARSSAEPPMRRDTMHFGSRVPAAQPIEEETARRPVILVADDDARIRMVFRIKLEQKGFRPMEVPDGAEAWKAIEQGGIDAIVLDMKMPGLHGLEVLQRLVNTKRDIPVVICTAYDRLDDEFVVATYPKLRYLTKPVDADHLVETLTNLLAEQG